MITPDYIRNERSRLGLSQEGLAHFSGLTAKTIYNIESGKVIGSIPTMESIEKALKDFDRYKKTMVKS